MQICACLLSGLYKQVKTLLFSAAAGETAVRLELRL